MTANTNDGAYVRTDHESAELPGKVFQAEVKAIVSRRKNYHLDTNGLENENVQPDQKHGLVGVSFSGGGIRSSTFNLGVVQALDESSLLKRVDYLSTVSGGG